MGDGAQTKAGAPPTRALQGFHQPCWWTTKWRLKPHCLGLYLSVCAHKGKLIASLIQIMWQIGLFKLHACIRYTLATPIPSPHLPGLVPDLSPISTQLHISSKNNPSDSISAFHRSVCGESPTEA